MRATGPIVTVLITASLIHAQPPELGPPAGTPSQLPPVETTPATVPATVPALPPVAPATSAPPGPPVPPAPPSIVPAAAAVEGPAVAPTYGLDKPSGSTNCAMPALPDCDSWCGNITGCAIPGRFSVRHDAGDGVGFTRGFTYVEGFVPLVQPREDSLIFADARVVNFDDADRWEFNAGAGYRVHAPGSDVVLGANLFYDGRHTDTNYFHQVGLGGEILFPRVELRCNGYLIVGPDERVAAQSALFPLTIGDELIMARILTHDVALGGVDFEAGALLPALGPVAPRAFLGGYHYSAHNMPSVNGIRGRLEFWLGRNITLHTALQHDDVFDTTVSGGVALHFGGADARRNSDNDSPRGVAERLGQRVVRDVNIVIAQRRSLQAVETPPPPKNKPKEKPPGGGSTNEPPQPPKEEPPKEEPPKEDPPPGNEDPDPPVCEEPEPPVCYPWPPVCKPPQPRDCPPVCLPFPGRPGNRETFPGRRFPPGFHHDCFPGRGRYKHLGLCMVRCDRDRPHSWRDDD